MSLIMALMLCLAKVSEGHNVIFFFFLPFTEKYDYVGKLLKAGEEPTEYTDDEEVKDKKKD